MKIIRLLSLFLLTVFAFSTSIEFSGFSIFYGIDQDAFSGFWGISESGNNFSEQNIGSFTCNTQLWILHHPVTIYIDEGDSVIDLDYMYRYGPVNEDSVEWIHAVTEYSGQTYHPGGYWYAYWALDHTPLFDLPLDAGENYLEIALTARVIGIGGDTLTASFVVPDSLPFLAYFTVSDDGQSTTEPSLPIKLAYFRVFERKGKIELSWRTESETENSHFLVYRDNVVIDRMEGNGTCSAPHDYNFFDDKASPGTHEYAISDVSYHGEELLHDAVSVEVKAKAKVEEADFILNKAYPNPFNSGVTINYSIFAPKGATMDRQLSPLRQGYQPSPRLFGTTAWHGAGQATINEVRASVYDTNGNQVEELLNTEISAGIHTLTWDASEMPSGVYVVVMHAGNVVQSQKIVLMK